MVFNLDGGIGQHQHIGVTQAKARPVGAGRGAVDDRLARAARCVNHLHLLVAQSAAQHAAKALAERGFVHIKLVRVYRALHHVFTQAPGTGDEHHVRVTRLGVDGEHHAAGRLVAAHHLHHRHRQKHLEMVEPVVDAVRDGAVREQRGLTALDRVNQQLFALNVEVGVVLASKTGVGQVFGRGRTAHRHTQGLAAGSFQGAPGFTQLLLYRRGHGRAVNNIASPGAGLGQSGYVSLVQCIQQAMQRGPGVCRIQGIAVGLGGDGKAIGHTHPQGGELLKHLTQRGIFAAYQRQVS